MSTDYSINGLILMELTGPTGTLHSIGMYLKYVKIKNLTLFLSLGSEVIHLLLQDQSAKVEITLKRLIPRRPVRILSPHRNQA